MTPSLPESDFQLNPRSGSNPNIRVYLAKYRISRLLKREIQRLNDALR